MTSKKCSFDPTQYANTPMGMFHCPECGEMVLAGLPHLASEDDLVQCPKCEGSGIDFHAGTRCEDCCGTGAVFLSKE